METPETQFTTTPDGVRIAYQIVGDGSADLVVALPGQLPIDILWEDPSARQFLNRLGTFSRVILSDPRGWGVSEGTGPTLETFVEDYLAVMDAVGTSRAALLGFSEGSLVSLMLAASHPERTSSVVLLHGFARWARADDYEIGIPPRVVEWLRENIESQWGTGINVMSSPSAADDPDFRRWVAKCERVAASPTEARALLDDWLARDLRQILPTVRVPPLVLHRRDNPWIRVAHGRYLAERMPAAKYVELPGADHYFNVGDQDAILDEIEEFLTGARPVAEHDRVLSTVLFTDICGSTERAVELGDRRWRELLERQNALVLGEVDRHRGTFVKDTGDGGLATFDGPARAVRCAQAISRSVRTLGIEVRAGLHTGEVELRGDDIGGIAVHIGQRVSALAGPGEVLVSRTVTDLVAGSGLEFDDRGEHELKGVPGRWAIYAVKS